MSLGVEYPVVTGIFVVPCVVALGVPGKVSLWFHGKVVIWVPDGSIFTIFYPNSLRPKPYL